MGLAFIVTLTMIIIHFFYYQKKALTFLQNSILFMILTLLTTNYLTITGLNLKWISWTKDPYLFPTIPVYRDIVIPFIVLILVNAYISADLKKLKFLLFLFYLSVMLIIEYLLIYFSIFKYRNWNLGFTEIFNTITFIISLAVVKFMNKKGVSA